VLTVSFLVVVTAARFAAHDDAITVGFTNFGVEIPAHLSARNPPRLRVFVSTDAGRTWRHHQDLSPDAGHVSYEAAGDGLFLFASGP